MNAVGFQPREGSRGLLKVAPSVIAGDQARLADEVRAIEAAGADLVHLDIMDGHFVPNLTLGPGVVKDLRKATTLPFDCHLMLDEPHRFVRAFIEAGADRICVHVEVRTAEQALREVRAAGRLAGLAFNPDTPVTAAAGLLDLADFVVVMTVYPGFYGQTMIGEALDKVPALRDQLWALGRDPVIQVDGGVAPENVGLVAASGATEVVAGAAVFKSPDYRAAIEALRWGGPMV